MPDRPFVLVLCLVGLLAACAAETVDPQSAYRATIRRSSFGVAHIEATDLGSLGFGEGFAQAEDHLCSIADQVVKARGERSKHFGRGSGDAHLLNDVAMRGLGIYERAAADLAAAPEEIRSWYRGFAAGYNRYLETTAPVDHPAWCREAAWVGPITADDLVAYLRQLTLVLPFLGDRIAAAAPPAAESAETRAARASDRDRRALARALPAVGASAVGASNGWALGSEATAGGRGMLLANPHYPWVGSNRFWEKHLTIPGELDVYGVSLIGIPGVAIGFNRHVAWTHTVSAATRLTVMKLDLVPGDPTRYRYGDEERAMEARAVAVEVRGEDGGLERVERTVWHSHHGPILDLPGLGWTAEHAFAVRDANRDNDAANTQWLAMMRADGMDALQAAHAEHQAMPWVNTIAASADGRAWYADAASTPNLSREAIAAWLERREADDLTRALWRQSGLVLLDGSDPMFDWQDDPAARDPGVVPFRDMPRLERRDYVWNANDSFWLAHVDAPIEGDFSPLHGEQRTVRSLRSRMNELTLSGRAPDRPAGDDGRFDLDELTTALLANRSHAADLLLPELVARCRATPSVTGDGGRHELAAACDVLAAWDGRYDLDSRGAVLFREWITKYRPADLRDAGRLFAVGFDPDDPVATPHTLASPTGGHDRALENLARAASLLASRGIALDTPLGDLQHHDKAGRRIPVHGGDGAYEGLLNMQRNGRNRTTLEPRQYTAPVDGSRFLTEAGYPIIHGSSFILALEFTDQGPQARAILTYGQSGDPSSPHFTDQTEMFARKEWRTVAFEADDVAADVQRTYEVSGGKPMP